MFVAMCVALAALMLTFVGASLFTLLMTSAAMTSDRAALVTVMLYGVVGVLVVAGLAGFGVQ